MAEAVQELAHEPLVISFGTPVAEAHAAAVAATMRAIVTLLDAANNEVKPSARLVLKARAFTNGSLELPFEIIGPVTLFLGANLSTIKTVLDLVKQYFEIRLLSKGKSVPPPDAKGQITIQNLTVNNTGTINLLINPQVNSAVGEAANAIEADETIKDVRVLHGEERMQIVEVKRTQLDYLKHDDTVPPVELPAARERAVKRAALVVRSPDLLGDSKWSFNYKEHKIEASLQDDGFLAEVRNGERSFTAGTLLVADMTVTEEYDLPTNTFLPKKYTITKVHQLEQQRHLPSTSKADSPKKSGKSKGRKK